VGLIRLREHLNAHHGSPCRLGDKLVFHGSWLMFQVAKNAALMNQLSYLIFFLQGFGSTSPIDCIGGEMEGHGSQGECV